MGTFVRREKVDVGGTGSANEQKNLSLEKCRTFWHLMKILLWMVWWLLSQWSIKVTATPGVFLFAHVLS